LSGADGGLPATGPGPNPEDRPNIRIGLPEVLSGGWAEGEHSV